MTNLPASSEMLPSRKDENYRYTQISFDLSLSKNWESEKLSNTQKIDTPFTPWKDDFYLKALEGVKNNQILPPKSEEWIFLHSQGEGDKVRGTAEITIPKGKKYKIFELLENTTERSLLMRKITIEEGADVEYFLLQNQNLSNTFILRHFFDVAPKAKATFRFFHLGAKKGQHRVVSRVPADAEFHLEGASRLHNGQHIDFWAESDHTGARGLSRTAVWNVLADQATAVFNGMIRIVPGCPQTQAFQSNKTLLLSEKARVHTLPKLEIATDDVKCSHGASVSSLDDSQLFYLQSRGINKASAEQMLIDAFTQPVLQYLPKHLVSQELQRDLNIRGELDAF